MLTLHAGTATHRGLVRERNEDSLVASGSVFAVADGMGGHAAGDVASRIAVSHLHLLGQQSAVVTQDVTEALSSANTQILASAGRRRDQLGMGTTICGIALVEIDDVPHWLVFNIGDSRVYRFTDGLLRQITTDHSEVTELVAAGELSEQQARTYERRHVITRSLGTVPSPIADLWVLPQIAGERFLVCSDGLHGEVDDAAIAAALSSQPDPQRAADHLIALALAAGGRDNVTVIVVGP